jgi:gluconokinase
MERVLKVPALTEDDSRVLALPPASHGITILPFITGERSLGWHADAPMTITGLHAQTSPVELLRAGMESLAYQLAAVFGAVCQALQVDQRAQKQVDQRAQKLVASGGALLGSPALAQIVADTLGVPLYPSRYHEASARGAALLALETLGRVPEAALAPSQLQPPVVPDMGRHAIYQQARERQLRLYHLLLEARP